MSDKPIHDSDEEARVERARQPPEPAKPYGDDDLAFFRERARQRIFSLSGPPARLLATINLREAERDELRQAVRALLGAAKRHDAAKTFGCDLLHSPEMDRLRALVEKP